MNEKMKKKYFKLYELVANVYNHILLNTEEGEKPLAYLKSRGFTKDIIQKLNIGYSYKGNMLSFLLQRHGFDLKLGEQFGLLKEFDKEPKYRDFFHGRIMFPIRNEYGEIVAFAGRVLPGNTHPAKYLNTPETDYFCKGEIIYNLDLAKNAIKKKNAALIFEGYFDVATAVQVGIQNVVSLMGTALTDVQVQKLRQYTNRAVLCLDGDRAGWENAKRNAEMLLKYDFEVRIATITEGDPHEYISERGKNDFTKNIICKAVDYHTFLKEFMKHGKDFSNEIDRLLYTNGVLSHLNTATLEQQGQMFRELAKEMNVPTNLLMSAIRSEIYKK